MEMVNFAGHACDESGEWDKMKADRSGEVEGESGGGRLAVATEVAEDVVVGALVDDEAAGHSLEEGGTS